MNTYRDWDSACFPIARLVLKVCVYLFTALLMPPSFASDILFLLDSSQDVGPANFYLQKNFIHSLGRYLRIAPTRSRAGIVSYGDRPSVITSLGAYNTTSDFYRCLDDADYVGGVRRVDRALDSAASMFSSARPAVPKVVILFTAGDKREGSDAREIGAAMERLGRIGVKTYVISVGKRDTRVNVKKPSDMFAVSTYRNLLTLAGRLATYMSRDTGK